MHLIVKRVGFAALCLILGLPLWAQSLSLQKPSNPPAEAAPPSDPLGRETPSGCIFGFLQAAQASNYKAAAQYLQMTVAQRRAEGEELAEQMKVVMDHGFIGNLKRIPATADVAPDEGVPFNHYKAGTLSIGDTETDLLLVHISDPALGHIWLISVQTLSKVPELYSEVQVNEVEAHLPHVLVEQQFWGMPLWQWLAVLVAFPVSALFGWIVVRALLLPRKVWAQYRKQEIQARWDAVSAPVWLMFGTVFNLLMIRLIGLPLLHRHNYLRIARIVLIVGFAWLVLRLTARLMQRLRETNFNSGRRGAVSILLLGERILKVIIIVIAGFAVLGSLGFDMTTALAGLGIGGIAIAFAAQKTLENLFGGVSVLGDEVIRVGDNCQFGNRVGRVEDISLRSTRIRTVERTELSIPNGALATMNVENLSRRDKMLFNTKFGLRCETSADQLRYVLAEARRMLYEHPRIESESARIRFVEFQDSALGIEIFSYILTREAADFNAIREDVLFRLLEIVDQAGTGLAFPAQTVYLTRDAGLNKERTTAALQQVKAWREEKQLPFPDFASAEIAEFQGTLPYPELDSAVARRANND